MQRRLFRWRENPQTQMPLRLENNAKTRQLYRWSTWRLSFQHPIECKRLPTETVARIHKELFASWQQIYRRRKCNRWRWKKRSQWVLEVDENHLVFQRWLKWWEVQVLWWTKLILKSWKIKLNWHWFVEKVLTTYEVAKTLLRTFPLGWMHLSSKTSPKYFFTTLR